MVRDEQRVLVASALELSTKFLELLRWRSLAVVSTRLKLSTKLSQLRAQRRLHRETTSALSSNLRRHLDDPR